jgi:hypothetical protein
MPFGVQRGWMRYALPRPEILSYPLSTNVIDSVVVNAAGVAPDASGPYMNRRYLVAGTVLSKRADNTYEKYTAATDVAAGSVRTVGLVGPPTGGTFAVGLGAQSTGQLAYNITAAAFQTALQGLSNVGAGNATVTGPVADAQGTLVYTITFAQALGEPPVLTADATLLTGPGNQDVVVQETQQETPAGAQNVAGILFDTVEFADNSELSDEPVAMLRRNVSFQANKIIGFAANQAAITAALPTCEFL